MDFYEHKASVIPPYLSEEFLQVQQFTLKGNSCFSVVLQLHFVAK